MMKYQETSQRGRHSRPNSRKVEEIAEESVCSSLEVCFSPGDVNQQFFGGGDVAELARHRAHWMKPRHLLSMVNRLPTISEMQEVDPEVGDPKCPTNTMTEYVDSIKELSQPALYPLHGPLKGHRRWMAGPPSNPNERCARVTPVAPYHSSMAYTPWAPIGPSDVSLIVAPQSNCETLMHFNHDPLDWFFTQSQFAGLA